jgi:hypothetical protein
MQTPWAILLCQFLDDPSEPPFPRTVFDDLFTNSGSGHLNMVDFFSEMSHGSLDLSASQVFGWFDLDHTFPEWQAEWSKSVRTSREKLIAWARSTATKNGVDLSRFFSVVVITNPASDLFGGADGMCTGDGRWDNGMSSISPSLVGQEMGHTYGLDHSRADGSDVDYMDNWDVMSTANAFMAAHPTITDQDSSGRPIFRIGPGLNAANMWGRGWLDLNRVWTAGAEEYGTTVQLRPLHHRDLPGHLAARVGDYFFELRVPERWDAAIGGAAILVHSFFLGRSYIHAGSTGRENLHVGDRFVQGDTTNPLAPLLLVEVTEVDGNARTATLRVTRRVERRAEVVGPGQVIGRGDSDGGVLIIIGGKIIRIPPRSPLRTILEELSAIAAGDSITHGATRDLLQRETWRRIMVHADAQEHRLGRYREPTPLIMKQHEVEDL